MPQITQAHGHSSCHCTFQTLSLSTRILICSHDSFRVIGVCSVRRALRLGMETDWTSTPEHLSYLHLELTNSKQSATCGPHQLHSCRPIFFTNPVLSFPTPAQPFSSVSQPVHAFTFAARSRSPVSSRPITLIPFPVPSHHQPLPLAPRLLFPHRPSSPCLLCSSSPVHLIKPLSFHRPTPCHPTPLHFLAPTGDPGPTCPMRPHTHHHTVRTS